MSNLPDGCTQADVDRAAGGYDPREDDDNCYQCAQPETFTELLREFLALPHAEVKAAMLAAIKGER